MSTGRSCRSNEETGISDSRQGPSPLAAFSACAGAFVILGTLGVELGGSALGNLVRQLVGVAGPAVAVPLLLGLAPGAALGPVRATRRQVVGALFVGASWWAVALFAVLPALLHLLPPANEELAKVAQTLMGEKPHPAAVVVGLVAAPALAEELLFRGLLCGALWRRYGKTVAVVASALAFSLFHPPLSRVALAFATGLVLGGVFVRSRSLVAAMVAHGVHNAMVLLAVPALSKPGPSASDLLPATGTSALAAVAVAVGTMYIGFRGLEHANSTDLRPPDKIPPLR